MSLQLTTTIAGRRFVADLGDSVSLAVSLDFRGPQPNAFFLPRAECEAVRIGGYVGATRLGGSSNCSTITLTPHGNGTHTECVGHIVDEHISVSDVVDGGLSTAVVVTLPVRALAASGETAAPPAMENDDVITRADLQAAVDAIPGGDQTEAIIVRLDYDRVDLASATWSGNAPPYFTQEAITWLARGPWVHLVTEIPSLDRDDDDGAMFNHRAWWGLSEDTTSIVDALRGDRSVTEMACVPERVHDGLWLLALELPAFLLDAAPSRPRLYPLREQD